MSTSLDAYPNSYDLQAIQPIEEILCGYFCKIDNMYDFEKATLIEKRELIQSLSLRIDSALNLIEHGDK